MVVHLVLDRRLTDIREDVEEKTIILKLQAAGVEVHGLRANSGGVVHGVDVNIQQIGNLQSSDNNIVNKC